MISTRRGGFGGKRFTSIFFVYFWSKQDLPCECVYKSLSSEVECSEMKEDAENKHSNLWRWKRLKVISSMSLKQTLPSGILPKASSFHINSFRCDEEWHNQNRWKGNENKWNSLVAFIFRYRRRPWIGVIVLLHVQGQKETGKAWFELGFWSHSFVGVPLSIGTGLNQSFVEKSLLYTSQFFFQYCWLYFSLSIIFSKSQDEKIFNVVVLWFYSNN